MTTTLQAPVITRKTPENTYRYAGGTVSILLSGADTGGQFAVWESIQKPGSEPPLHVHHTMDETFIVLEGEMRFIVGGQIHTAPAGSFVFAPRGVPHTFKIKSPSVRALAICTPSGFEEWFRALGTPVSNFELPDRIGPPSEAEVGRMITLGKRLETEVLGEVDF